MCGLCGVTLREPVAAEAVPAVRAMTELMRRRGPDDEGLWHDEHTVLGFRRLSILDLSDAAHQPMPTADDRFLLVFNGELYNFRELRAQLERQGVRFRSDGDSEVVLEALAAWGPAALRRFNGMFALAFYDRLERRLVLARDPMGIKPLYYLEAREGVVFGSQYDQIVRSPWCDRGAVDDEAVGLYLRLSYVPAPYGVIAGTRQVQPGEYVEVVEGRVERRARFFEWPDVEGPYLTSTELAEQVPAVLEQAVARQRVSDVPIGTFLSGGIDSPLVSALLAASGASAPAFSIGSEDAAYDESRAASAFAEDLGLEHVLRTCTGNDALDLLDDHTAAYGEPFADFSSFPSMLASSLAADRVKVVLSGDGGDELFWGYLRSWKALANRPLFRLPQPLRLGGYGAMKVARRHRPDRGVLFPTLGDWYLNMHTFFREPDRSEVAAPFDDLPTDFDLYRLAGVPSRDGLAQWTRRNEVLGHLQMVLLKVDRASMHYGLEVRVPLLDLEVVKLATRIAPDDCMDETLGKLPLRHELARRTRPELIDPEKRGFNMPMQQWLCNELRPQVEDRLLQGGGFLTDRLDHRKLRAVYERHCEGSADFTGALWSLLAMELWADRHLRPLDLA